MIILMPGPCADHYSRVLGSEWSRRIGVVFTSGVVVLVREVGILQLWAVLEDPC